MPVFFLFFKTVWRESLPELYFFSAVPLQHLFYRNVRSGTIILSATFYYLIKLTEPCLVVVLPSGPKAITL